MRMSHLVRGTLISAIGTLVLLAIAVGQSVFASTPTIGVTPDGDLTFIEGVKKQITVTVAIPPNGTVNVSFSDSTGGRLGSIGNAGRFDDVGAGGRLIVTRDITPSVDANDEDETGSLTITAIVANGEIVFLSKTINFTVKEPPAPSAGSIIVTPTSPLTIAENGEKYLYISLSAAPTSNATIALTTGAFIDVTPASLTFTSDNWSTAQTATLTGANDINARDDTDTLTLTATGGITAPVVDISVKVTDISSLPDVDKMSPCSGADGQHTAPLDDCIVLDTWASSFNDGGYISSILDTGEERHLTEGLAILHGKGHHFYFEFDCFAASANCEAPKIKSTFDKTTAAMMRSQYPEYFGFGIRCGGGNLLEADTGSELTEVSNSTPATTLRTVEYTGRRHRDFARCEGNANHPFAARVVTYRAAKPKTD